MGALFAKKALFPRDECTYNHQTENLVWIPSRRLLWLQAEAITFLAWWLSADIRPTRCWFISMAAMKTQNSAVLFWMISVSLGRCFGFNSVSRNRCGVSNLRPLQRQIVWNPWRSTKTRGRWSRCVRSLGSTTRPRPQETDHHHGAVFWKRPSHSAGH